MSTNSTEKLIEATSSQNSLVLQRSSTATSASLVLNNEDESLINNDPDVILQQQHPQGNYSVLSYKILPVFRLQLHPATVDFSAQFCSFYWDFAGLFPERNLRNERNLLGFILEKTTLVF